jgi:hypothetical protein
VTRTVTNSFHGTLLHGHPYWQIVIGTTEMIVGVGMIWVSGGEACAGRCA